MFQDETFSNRRRRPYSDHVRSQMLPAFHPKTPIVYYQLRAQIGEEDARKQER